MDCDQHFWNGACVSILDRMTEELANWWGRQFGNMLVLYAAYTAPHPALSSLIDRDTLLRLHNRTAGILKENEAISPILAKDLKILEHVRNRVFSYLTSNPSASQSSSFSSRV